MDMVRGADGRVGAGSQLWALAPRCGAQLRGRPGCHCRAPCVRGRTRCRLHGGAHGSGGQPGNRNAFVHGRYGRGARMARLVTAAALKTIAAVMIASGVMDPLPRRFWRSRHG